MTELTSEEKETQINWNNAEQDARIYTYDSRIIRRLKDLGVDVKVDESGLVEAKIPKKWVKINAPRVLSDEQKQRLSEQLQKARK